MVVHQINRIIGLAQNKTSDCNSANAKQKVNRPVASQAVVQLLEVINKVSEQRVENKENDEILDETEENIEEFSGLSQYLIEKYS